MAKEPPRSAPRLDTGPGQSKALEFAYELIGDDVRVWYHWPGPGAGRWSTKVVDAATLRLLIALAGDEPLGPWLRRHFAAWGADG